MFLLAHVWKIFLFVDAYFLSIVPYTFLESLFDLLTKVESSHGTITCSPHNYCWSGQTFLELFLVAIILPLLCCANNPLDIGEHGLRQRHHLHCLSTGNPQHKGLKLIHSLLTPVNSQYTKTVTNSLINMDDICIVVASMKH